MAATKNTQTYLVSDTRERHVLGFIENLFDPTGITRTVAQINTGDYLICRRFAGGQPEILACFERKSLKDFASTFNDGRYENRLKMLDLRDKTGCQLYFIVEGPPFPKPTWTVPGSRTPYGNILSSMTNMMIREGIHVVQTKDEMGTAQRLLDFVRSFTAIQIPYTYPILKEAEAAPTVDGGAEPAVNPTGVPPMVLGLIEKSNSLLTVEIWARLTGISIVTAQSFVNAFTVADLVSGRVTLEELDAVRTASGRQITKAGKTSVRGLRRGVQKEEIKVLSGVPGISPAMATQILTTGGKDGKTISLKEFLEYGRGVMATAMIKQKGRTVRLGDARAERILRLMNYSAPEAEEPDTLIVAGADIIDDDELDKLLGEE